MGKHPTRSRIGRRRFFKTNVVKLGGGGFAVALSGKPLHSIGGLHLHYGTSESMDDQGNPTGTFDSFEDINSWSFGLSVGQLGESIARMFGHDPPTWSQYGDVSFGMTAKEVEIQLGPPSALGAASTSAHDLGLHVRLSPLAWFPATRNGVLGLDLAYGWSNLSYDGKGVVYVGEDLATPASEHLRYGLAGRVRVDWPTVGFLPGPEWLQAGFQPLISVGGAFDHSRIGVEGGRYITYGLGWELALANMVWVRQGHYQDIDSDIEDDTWGWGAGLPLGRLAGVRYDYARFPQASGLEDVQRRAVSAWIDPLEIWSLLRSGGQPEAVAMQSKEWLASASSSP
jgi:hypothetical protein